MTYDLADPTGTKNTYSVALSITNVTGGKLAVDVGIVAPGVEGERKAISGNTLTVTFRQALRTQNSRTAAIRHNQPQVSAAACAPPREKSSECQKFLSEQWDLANEPLNNPAILRQFQSMTRRPPV